MADRLIVMEAGRAAQIATPMEVFERPANLFVAQFMGAPAMNIFDPVRAGLTHTPPGALAGIRPEHLEVAEEGMPLAVDLVEPGDGNTDPWQATLRPAADLAARGPPPPAEGMSIRFSGGSAAFF